VRALLIIAALAAAYVGAATLGFRAALVADQSARHGRLRLALWRAVSSTRIWPGIWVGALIANLTTHTPLLAACGIATGNTLERLGGAWLLRHVPTSIAAGTVRQVTALIMLAAVASTTISARSRRLLVMPPALQQWADFGMFWRRWWLGDAMGDVLIAPLLLTLRYWTIKRPQPRISEIASRRLAIALRCWYCHAASHVTGIPRVTVFPLYLGRVAFRASRCGAHPAPFGDRHRWHAARHRTFGGAGPPQESLILLQLTPAVTARADWCSAPRLPIAIARLGASDRPCPATILSEERVCNCPRASSRSSARPSSGMSAFSASERTRKGRSNTSTAGTRASIRSLRDEVARLHSNLVRASRRVWSTRTPPGLRVVVDANSPAARSHRRSILTVASRFPDDGTHSVGLIEFFARESAQVDRALLR